MESFYKVIQSSSSREFYARNTKSYSEHQVGRIYRISKQHDGALLSGDNRGLGQGGYVSNVIDCHFIPSTKEEYDFQNHIDEIFKIKGIGAINQPTYTINGPERRELKKERSSLKSSVKYSEGERKEYYQKQLDEMDAKLNELFKPNMIWMVNKLKIVGAKQEKLQRVLEDKNNIPEELQQYF